MVSQKPIVKERWKSRSPVGGGMADVGVGGSRLAGCAPGVGSSGQSRDVGSSQQKSGKAKTARASQLRRCDWSRAKLPELRLLPLVTWPGRGLVSGFRALPSSLEARKTGVEMKLEFTAKQIDDIGLLYSSSGANFEAQLIPHSIKNTAAHNNITMKGPLTIWDSQDQSQPLLKSTRTTNMRKEIMLTTSSQIGANNPLSLIMTKSDRTRCDTKRLNQCCEQLPRSQPTTRGKKRVKE